MSVSTTATSGTDRPPRRRRWVPLSLRMFVAINLLAAVVGVVWLGARSYQNSRLANEIRKVGRVSFRLPAPAWMRFPPLAAEMLEMIGRPFEVSLTASSATDDTLLCLRGQSTLE